MTVSGPPHKARNTSPTSCGVASPAFNGTIVRSGPSTVCRNGICTSTACSCVCVGSLTIIAGAGAPPPDEHVYRNEAAHRKPIPSLKLYAQQQHLPAHRAQRRFKRRCGRASNASHGHTVSRPHNYRTSHASPPSFEQSIGKRGRRAGIHITGMRHDYSLWHSRWKRGLQLLQNLSTVTQLMGNELLERCAVSGVERTSHRWRTYCASDFAAAVCRACCI